MVYPSGVARKKTHDVGTTDRAQRRRFTAPYRLKVLAALSDVRSHQRRDLFSRQDGHAANR